MCVYVVGLLQPLILPYACTTRTDFRHIEVYKLCIWTLQVEVFGMTSILYGTVAYILHYTVKNGQHTLMGVQHAGLKLPLTVYSKGVYVPSRV